MSRDSLDHRLDQTTKAAIDRSVAETTEAFTQRFGTPTATEATAETLRPCPYPSRGKHGAPAGYDIDPGAGSGCDKFQRDYPDERQLADIARRGGSITPLWPRPSQALTETDPLVQAAVWFEEYAASHEAKGATDKAARNLERANFCRRTALSTPDTKDA